MSKASAPGKLILIGEHSVVYGKPAILAAIDRRIHAECKRAEKIIIRPRWSRLLEFPVKETHEFVDRLEALWKKGKGMGDFSELVAITKEPDNYKRTVVGIILKTLGIKGGVDLSMDTEIPLGSGLGSSAAFSLACAAAISKAYGMELTRERINQLAFEAERLVNGNPSGADNTACCYGGIMHFQKGEPNKIKPVEFHPEVQDGFLLVMSRTHKRSTGELVQHVRSLEPAYREKRINGLGDATEMMLKALKKGDKQKIIDLMNKAQAHLAELGVSVGEIDSLARAVRDIGGGAKLCGAGGGGVVLCYHKDKAALKELISGMGYDPWEVRLGAEGMRMEHE